MLLRAFSRSTTVLQVLIYIGDIGTSPNIFLAKWGISFTNQPFMCCVKYCGMPKLAKSGGLSYPGVTA
jgi:hypothetical protein